MKTSTNLLQWVAACSVGVTLIAACGDDEEKSGATSGTGGSDAGGDAQTSAGGTGAGGGASGGASAGGAGGAPAGGAGGAGDAGPAGLSLCGDKPVAEQIDCGKYIVEHVAVCGDCHSERLPDGSIDPAFFLAGNTTFADLDPTDATAGLVPTPNLTQLSTFGWTATDVKNAFQNGVRPANRGGGLFPIMPYYVFHNMADADADAVAAFILSLTPITHDIPTRQPLPGPFASMPLPVPVFDAAKIPDTTLAATDANYEEAQLGKYLAGNVGICMECHTARDQNGALDETRLFAGGEPFVLGPPFPTVTSLNITPATSGIAGWTAADVQKVLLEGVSKDGTLLCPPMPVGPLGSFGGMKASDALAIGHYLTTLAPLENPEDGGRFPVCDMRTVFGPPPGDGGADASPGPTDASAGD